MKQYRTVIQYRKDGPVFYGVWTDKEMAEDEILRQYMPSTNITANWDDGSGLIGPPRRSAPNPYRAYIEERGK